MKSTLVAGLLATVQIAPAALADSTEKPDYVGVQTGNPETDTFALRPSDHGGKRLAFIGPAHQVGTTTGDLEKDTWGFEPVLVEKVADAE